MSNNMSAEKQLSKEMAKPIDNRGWIRRALSGVVHSRAGKIALTATAVGALSQTGVGDVAGEVTRGVADAFNNAITDQYKPVASEAHLGGRMLIDFTQGPRNDIFPRIRSNPIIYNPERDGQYNGINLDEITAINDTSVNINPGTKIKIDNFTTVQGTDADDNLTVGAKGNWLVLELTMQDGSEILGYISLSNQTSQNIDIKDYGKPEAINPTTPVPDLNTTTVVNP